jgi:hypothetical protein
MWGAIELCSNPNPRGRATSLGEAPGEPERVADVVGDRLPRALLVGLSSIRPDSLGSDPGEVRPQYRRRSVSAPDCLTGAWLTLPHQRFRRQLASCGRKFGIFLIVHSLQHDGSAPVRARKISGKRLRCGADHTRSLWQLVTPPLARVHGKGSFRLNTSFPLGFHRDRRADRHLETFRNINRGNNS